MQKFLARSILMNNANSPSTTHITASRNLWSEIYETSLIIEFVVGNATLSTLGKCISHLEVEF